MSAVAASGSTTSGDRSGRPRRNDVDERLRSSVLSLLHSGGPTAVTVEAVATRSGVAKTTVYRRHSDRGDLLRTVVLGAIGTPEPVAQGSVRDRIRSALKEVWRQMSDVLGPGGLTAIVMNSDPEFTELFRSALRPFEDALVAQIEADARSGLLRADVDADGVVTLFVGAYLGELVRRGRVGDDWADRCLDTMWATMAHRGRGS